LRHAGIRHPARDFRVLRERAASSKSQKQNGY
jgi:hypothetical protein